MKQKYIPDKYQGTLDSSVLPLEIISKCLTYLPLSDVRSSSLVSKDFYFASSDQLLWKELCERDFQTPFYVSSWKYTYKQAHELRWVHKRASECSGFYDNSKTIRSSLTYGVNTCRLEHVFSSDNHKYVFDIRVNYRRKDYYFGFGFLDVDSGFDFITSSYQTSNLNNLNQWIYWCDGNIWDILGNIPTGDGVMKRFQPRNNGRTFETGDIVGVLLEYQPESTVLKYFLNGKIVHHLCLPKCLKMYFATYLYTSKDSLTLQHCAIDKYDSVCL